MSEYLEDTYRQLSARFDLYPNTPLVVVLYPQSEYYDVTDAPSWSGGVNDGKIRLPVKGLTSLSNELKSVLTHELTHSFVNIKTSKNCPVWLQEGLAQYEEGKRVEGQNFEIIQKLVSANQLP